MTRMSLARARGTRRTDLDHDVAAGALCADPRPTDAPTIADWYQRDGESTADWALRRVALLDYCRGCPVISQCRELALRYDDRGDHDSYDDHVRGGLTAAQLATTRRRQRDSLRRAITADQAGLAVDEERRRIHQLTERLQNVSISRRYHQRNDGGNGEVRVVLDELQARRAARRAKNSWKTAA